MKIIFKNRVYRNYQWMGSYCNETSTIIIQKDLKLKDKIETIIHEFGHAVIYKLKLSWNVHYVYDIISILLDYTRSYKKKQKTFIYLTTYYFKKANQ